MSVTRRSSPPRCRDAEKIGLSRISPRLRVSAVKNRMAAHFVVGIDLGTTNSALALRRHPVTRRAIDLRRDRAARRRGRVCCRGRLSLVPLSRRRARAAAPRRWRLPWDAERDSRVGEFARTQGSHVPGRLVSSAKSWLCHPRRRSPAPILPWGEPAEDVAQLSPVEASARYLRHLAKPGTQRAPDARWPTQDVVLTVPASFDAVARELTVEAAARPASTNVTLLEEPQAAFYAWLDAAGDDWRKQVEPSATWCWSWTSAAAPPTSRSSPSRDEDGDLALERSPSATTSCSAATTWIWRSRAASSRAAARRASSTARAAALTKPAARKERLLATSAAPRGPITSPAADRTRSAAPCATRSRAPRPRSWCSTASSRASPPTQGPALAPRAGIQEFGLPFAADPALSRHLAAFLALHAGARRPTRLRRLAVVIGHGEVPRTLNCKTPTMVGGQRAAPHLERPDFGEPRRRRAPGQSAAARH